MKMKETRRKNDELICEAKKRKLEKGRIETESSLKLKNLKVEQEK